MPKQKTATTASTSGHGRARNGVRGRGRGRGRRNANGVSRVDQRNWSELPREVLHRFSKKLPDLSDFIRFRAVCKTWLLSAPINDPPPQLPWLLERREDPEEDRENAIIRFYCLSSGKVHSIFCPGSRRAWLEGPGYRYLLASHSRSFETYLLNPLTDEEIDYSIPKVFSWSHYIGPNGNIVIVSGSADHYRLPDMEWNTAPPMMAFLRPDVDEDWVHVAGVGQSGNAFYMGQYFGNDSKTGITKVIDIATRNLAYQVEPPEDTNPLQEGSTILVESGGKILRLFQYHEAKQYHFDIYCLRFDGKGKPLWVKISNIGDQILFLDGSTGLSFCASNFPGFKANCIYFIDDFRKFYKYNIKDGTTEVPPCPFDSLQTWFIPSLVKASQINHASTSDSEYSEPDLGAFLY